MGYYSEYIAKTLMEKKKPKKSQDLMHWAHAKHMKSLEKMNLPPNTSWLDKQTPDSKRPPRYPPSSLHKCTNATKLSVSKASALKITISISVSIFESVSRY